MPDRNRIDQVTTKSGDGGETSLADGKRYPKSSLRIELIGSLDELNCALGLVQHLLSSNQSTQLKTIQSRIFDLGAAVATAKPQPYWDQQSQSIEEWTTVINSNLMPLKEFVLPGGSEVAARLHLARSICRRVERVFWRLQDEELIKAHIAKYINRLSDYLFVLARQVSEDEVLWEPLDERDAS